MIALPLAEAAASIFDMPAVTLSVALTAGMGAIMLGTALRAPGIIFALAAGVLLGPDIANVVRPATLGAWLPIIVGFCVSVILFEGALSLNPRRLRRAGKPVRRLITVGAFITAAGATLVARLALGWRWEIAALLGALFIVTGPTVIAPLLRRLRAEKTVSTVLSAEGVLGDAVGAVMATVVFGIAVSPVAESFGNAALQLGRIIAVGGLTGLAAGSVIALIGRWRSLAAEGRGRIAVLVLVVLAYQVSNALAHESGVVAAVVAGLVAGLLGTHEQEELLEFKEELSTMFIGLLFVILAANVRLAEAANLAAPALIVAASMVFVVRPLAVLIGTWRSGLSPRQALFVAWIGPRGIVAAAVASLVATELTAQGLREGAEFRAVVFITIVFTVTMAGLTGRLAGRVLGVLAREDNGWVVFGANGFALLVAKAIRDAGEDVVCIDKNPAGIAAAEKAGIAAVLGDAMDENTLVRAGVEGRRGAMGLSPNEAVNMLFLQRCRRLNRKLKLFAALESLDSGITKKRAESQGVRVLSGRPLNVGALANMAQNNQAEIVAREAASMPRAEGEAPKQGAPAVLGGPVLFTQTRGRLEPVSVADDGKGAERVLVLSLKAPRERAEKAGASGAQPAVQPT